jgi:hypothetical protein
MKKTVRLFAIACFVMLGSKFSNGKVLDRRTLVVR